MRHIGKVQGEDSDYMDGVVKGENERGFGMKSSGANSLWEMSQHLHANHTAPVADEAEKLKNLLRCGVGDDLQEEETEDNA